MSEANNCLFQERIDHIRKCDSGHRINLSYSHTLNFFNNTQLLRKSQSYNGRGVWLSLRDPKRMCGKIKSNSKDP